MFRLLTLKHLEIRLEPKISLLTLNFKLSKFYNYKSNLNSCIWMHINCIYASLLRSIIRWKIIKAGLNWLQNVPKCLCFWWDWSRHWSIFSSLLLLVSFIGKMDFVLLWVTFSTDTSSSDFIIFIKTKRWRKL